MPGAMAWFRWSALVTVLVGLRYFQIHLSSDAKAAGDPSLVGKWLGWWLLVWGIAFVFIYGLQLPAKGMLHSPGVRVLGVGCVAVPAPWLVFAFILARTASHPPLPPLHTR